MTAALDRIHTEANAEEALVSARRQLFHHLAILGNMTDDAGPAEGWAINGLKTIFENRVKRLEAIARGEAE